MTFRRNLSLKLWITVVAAWAILFVLYVPAAWNGDLNDGNDIAIMQLSSPINSITPASIYRGSSELGAEVTMVGYGRTGDGQTGSNLVSGTRRAGGSVVRPCPGRSPPCYLCYPGLSILTNAIVLP